MSVQTVSNGSGSHPTIRIDGEFDFSVHRAFREAYRHLVPGSPVTVDLSKATYMDSAALGMLLMLREHVEGSRDTVTLRVNESPDIKRVVEIARFGELFQLE